MMTKTLFKLSLLAVVFGITACKEESAIIGQAAPEIAAYDLQGNSVKLEDWQGTRLLTFW